MGVVGLNRPPFPEKMDIQLSNNTSPWQDRQTRISTVASQRTWQCLLGRSFDIEKLSMSASSYPEIDHRHIVAVCFPHDSCQVLQVWGQEGPVGWCQAHGARLLVALEVCSPDATHVSFQWSIQRHKMELRQKTFIRTDQKSLSAISYSRLQIDGETGCESQLSNKSSWVEANGKI